MENNSFGIQKLRIVNNEGNTQETEIYAEPMWKPDLFKLQQEAPKCRAIRCSKKVDGAPNFYGSEYHGPISHKQAAKLLMNDGEYLIRLSPNSDNFHTLSLRLCGIIDHFKLYYDGRQHYVHEKKRFAKVEDLVMDGIITLYLERKAGSYIKLMHDIPSYEKSPYVTLNRIKRKTFDKHKQVESLPDVVVNYDKQHAFKPHTFKGFYWCEFCGNFLWGFIAQGVKCEDCGFSAHYRCSEKLPADCCPDLKQLRGVFGIDLTTLVKAHKITRPFVIDKCIKEIEARGLDAEGLYRVSGYQEEMDNLRMAFEKDGEKAVINCENYDNINVIASILKLYFRLLPIPLITYDAHPLLLKSIQASSLKEQINKVKQALDVLPPAHYNTLKYLMEHLYRVTQHSGENKMTAQNLGTVFAPSIMPPPDFSKIGDNIPDMCNEISALQLLITHNKMIFN